MGAPFETEIILIGLDSLYEAAREDRNVASPVLAPCSAMEALEAVMNARYGSHDLSALKGPTRSEEDLLSAEVLPRRIGPFFDGWEAVLLEGIGKERFIYRSGGRNVIGASWPIGTFRDVIVEARMEFERIAGGPSLAR